MAAKTMATMDATPNAYGGMSAVYPNLSQAQGAVSRNIMAQLNGQLSPGTMAGIQNAGARFGLTSLGSPGSDMAKRNTMALLGRTSEGQQQQGVMNFLNTLKGYSGTLAPTTGELLSNQLGNRSISSQSGQFYDSLSEQKRQFDMGFGEGQRQFDIGKWLQNQQYYAGLGPQYMNAMGSYLNWL